MWLLHSPSSQSLSLSPSVALSLGRAIVLALGTLVPTCQMFSGPPWGLGAGLSTGSMVRWGLTAQLRSLATEVRQWWVGVSQAATTSLSSFVPASPAHGPFPPQILLSSVACPMSRHLRPPGQIPLSAPPSAHLLPAAFIRGHCFQLYSLPCLFFPLAKPPMATPRTVVRHKEELL